MIYLARSALSSDFTYAMQTTASKISRYVVSLGPLLGRDMTPYPDAVPSISTIPRITCPETISFGNNALKSVRADRN